MVLTGDARIVAESKIVESVVVYIAQSGDRISDLVVDRIGMMAACFPARFASRSIVSPLWCASLTVVPNVCVFVSPVVDVAVTVNPPSCTTFRLSPRNSAPPDDKVTSPVMGSISK